MHGLVLFLAQAIRRRQHIPQLCQGDFPKNVCPAGGLRTFFPVQAMPLPLFPSSKYDGTTELRAGSKSEIEPVCTLNKGHSTRASSGRTKKSLGGKEESNALRDQVRNAYPQNNRTCCKTSIAACPSRLHDLLFYTRCCLCTMLIETTLPFNDVVACEIVSHHVFFSGVHVQRRRFQLEPRPLAGLDGQLQGGRRSAVADRKREAEAGLLLHQLAHKVCISFYYLSKSSEKKGIITKNIATLTSSLTCFYHYQHIHVIPGFTRECLV